MAEVSTDLFHEILRSIQGRLSSIDAKMDEVKGELQAIRQHQLATSQEVGNIYVKLARHDEQLERIDRRLELYDPAH